MLRHLVLVPILSVAFIIMLLNQVLSASSDAIPKGIVQPRPIGDDSRIKIINYFPNKVIRYVGHYTYQSAIEFSRNEEIQTILMGTPTGWQIVQQTNRIFLKPINEDAETNMTIITNKRMYFFEMHAEEADGIEDENLSFIVKFIYPDVGGTSSVTNNNGSSSYGAPDLTQPQLYNFRYKVSGPGRAIEPLLIFDDSQFTYFKFRDVNAELPAIFLVNELGEEELVNYRFAHGYVTVERVHDRFTLRHDKTALCVFNENYNAQLWGRSQQQNKLNKDLSK